MLKWERPVMVESSRVEVICVVMVESSDRGVKSS